MAKGTKRFTCGDCNKDFAEEEGWDYGSADWKALDYMIGVTLDLTQHYLFAIWIIKSKKNK